MSTVKQIGLAVAALAFAALVAFTLMLDTSPRRSTPTTSPGLDAPFGSSEFCRADAPRLRRDRPDLYPTDVAAYEACVAAGGLVDELRDR